MGKDESWMMILTNSHHHHYGGKMLVNCANTGNDDFERMIMLMVVVVVIIIMVKATFDEVFKAKWKAECEEGASKEQEESEGPATPHVTAYLKISSRCHTTRSSRNEYSADVQSFILNQQLI